MPLLETSVEALTKDGVTLWQRTIPPALLSKVIEEYETANPVELNPIPKHVPLVVFWLHVEGQKKKFKLLPEMPSLEYLARLVAVKLKGEESRQLRLLETIIFNKPPKTSNTLHWHQDVSYFPLEPNNQIAVWIPFDITVKESGAMRYALGSHKVPARTATELHTGNAFHGDEREEMPRDPSAEGYRTVTYEMYPGDMLIHDGRTWHMSGPNMVANRQRRGLSLRYLVGDTHYAPHGAAAAAFLAQMDNLQPGDLIEDAAFPKLP